MPDTRESCLDYAIAYASMGWPVLALNWPRDDGKCSCGKIDCKSVGKHPYARLCPQGSHSATTDEATIRRWWMQYPDLNVGIVMDEYRYVIDIDPRNGGDDTWEQIKSQGHDDGPVCLTGGGGMHIFGRAIAPLRAGEVGTGIDFKAGPGAYVVAAPSLHASGKCYEWEMSSQPDLPLPVAPDWIVEQFARDQKKKATVLDLDLSKIRLSPEIKAVKEGGRNNELARLIGRWVTQGMKPDEVLILANGANKKFEPPLSEGEVRQVIQSVFDTDARNNPEKYAQIAVECSCQEEVEDGYPDKLLNPGGLLQEIMNHVDQSSAVSHPIYALGGALVAVGTAAGQRVMTSTGLRTHNYIVILGYSGSGKNAPQMAIPALFMHDHRLQNLNGPNELTSSAAIMRYLTKFSTCHCFVDEIGHLFSAMANPQSHLADLSGTLMKIWSSAALECYQKPYSDEKANIILHYPHMSVLGCSTPVKFWQSITSEDYATGLMSRTLVMQSSHQALRAKRVVRHDPDMQIVSMLAEIAGIQQVFSNGSNLIGKPNLIRMTPKAEEMMDQAEADWRDLNEKFREDTSLSAVYSRCAEHAKKLSLIHAVSINLSNILHSGIECESVQWSIDFVNHITKEHIASMSMNVSDSPWHKIQQRVVKLVRKKRSVARPGASMREILNGMRDIKGFDLKAAVQDMLTQGVLVELDHKPQRGPNVKIYGERPANP